MNSGAPTVEDAEIQLTDVDLDVSHYGGFDGFTVNPEIPPDVAEILATANTGDIGGPSIRPNEANDDPHRLARLFIDEKFTLGDGTNTLASWQGSYWCWDRLCWREFKKHEFLAILTESVKAEFDRLNVEQVANWNPNKKGEQPPKAQKVTKALLNNVDNAVASMVAHPDCLTMPGWLSDDSRFPANEVLATSNTLLHLPSLCSGKAGGISPTPMLFSANCLAYEYDPNADCQNWLAFLASVWPHDPNSICSLQEWFGYLLLPDTQHHKLLMLIGPPRSGKGTICRILRSLLGDANVASPTLSSLAGPFGLWPLLNKYVALIPDARLSGREDGISVVERLLSISGEDPQDIHRKNLSTLTAVRMPIRFVLMSNELPSMRDSSGALITRVDLLRMTESFVGREDKSLGDRLAQELPGILNWSIEGWRRLNMRGHFVQVESGRELLSDLEDLSSPIKQFIADCCNVGPQFEASVETLFETYQKWCNHNHREHVGTKQELGKNLRAAVPSLKRGQVREDRERFRIYTGIGVKFEW